MTFPFASRVVKLPAARELAPIAAPSIAPPFTSIVPTAKVVPLNVRFALSANLFAELSYKIRLPVPLATVLPTVIVRLPPPTLVRLEPSPVNEPAETPDEADILPATVKSPLTSFLPGLNPSPPPEPKPILYSSPNQLNQNQLKNTCWLWGCQ